MNRTRTRATIEAEMLATVADARAASSEHDEISVEIDHVKLDELLHEWQSIPAQRHA